MIYAAKVGTGWDGRLVKLVEPEEAQATTPALLLAAGGPGPVICRENGAEMLLGHADFLSKSAMTSFYLKVPRPSKTWIQRISSFSLVCAYTAASAVWTGWEWRNRLRGFFPCWPHYEASIQKQQWTMTTWQSRVFWSQSMHCCITFSWSPCFPDPFIQLVTYVQVDNLWHLVAGIHYVVRPLQWGDLESKKNTSQP